MTILCDLDGIVVDLLGSWLRRYNAMHKKMLTVADITQFDIDCVAPGASALLREPGMFDCLAPLPGAIAGLHYLNLRHEVVIVSSPSRLPSSAAEKLEWCRQWLPFISRQQIILTPSKWHVRGDVLIDDSPDQLRAWKSVNPGGRTVTITYPYNVDFKVDVRADDWRNTSAAWGSIRLAME